MSRHRNVRNLTEDDYYDDYDDYDDDYYEEEEFDDSYYKPAPKQQAFTPQLNVQPSPTYPTPKAAQQSNEEKIRLVEGMGFDRDMAVAALTAVSGNVQEAINRLLSGDVSSAAQTPAPGKSGVSKPPPGFGGPPTSEIKKGGIMKPPAGFGPPEETMKDGLKQAPADAVRPAAKARSVTPTRREGKSLQQKKDYGSPPKISEEIKAELSNQKSRLSMVVLGHVDAGKSTLMGQVLVQLGHVPKRTVQKYQKQATELGKASFALAWVMDEDDAERERGVTMDVGTKSVSTSQHDFVVLDAPGHADFVPSMITGAAAADVGILVVAATTGEFEAGFDGGGQTREHIILARGLGVSQLIVAVNKLDAMGWDEGRFEAIRAKVEPFLIQNRFAAKRIKFVPISGLTGANVKSKEATGKLIEWYKGPTLLEAMDDFQPAQRSADKPLRIVVNDVYADGSKGVTVRCRVVQGVVQVGEKIVVLPVGDEAAVSKIEHGSAATENRYKYAMAGDAAEIVLLGIDIARVATGNIISHPHWELRPPLKRKVRAKIMVMDTLTVPIIRGAQVLFHMHSIDVPAVVSKLVQSVNPKQKNSQKERPRVLNAGVSATVEMTFSEKVTIEPYNECRALGRFVLRRGGDTVAIGIVESNL